MNMKLRHYKATILPEIDYASENPLAPTRIDEEDKIKKAERQIQSTLN